MAFDPSAGGGAPHAGGCDAGQPRSDHATGTSAADALDGQALERELVDHLRCDSLPTGECQVQRVEREGIVQRRSVRRKLRTASQTVAAEHREDDGTAALKTTSLTACRRPGN